MTTRAASAGLPIAALVLGIVSIVFSFIVVGALFAVIGLALGAVHMGRHRTEARGLAVSGVVLSGVGFLASAGFGALYFLLFNSVLGAIGSSGNNAALLAWVGVEAPDFSVTTLDGKVVTLSELKGKRVVVDFWATWCGPCVREVPHFNQLANETSADELVLIGISSEPRDTIEPFVDKHSVVFPIASADDLPEPYSLLRAIPTKFFIDRNGVIQSVVFGSSNFDALKERALAEDYAGEVRSAPAEPADESADDTDDTDEDAVTRDG